MSRRIRRRQRRIGVAVLGFVLVGALVWVVRLSLEGVTSGGPAVDGLSEWVKANDAVQQAPGDPEARYRLAGLLLERGDAESAWTELERARALGLRRADIDALTLKILLARREYSLVLGRLAATSQTLSHSHRLLGARAAIALEKPARARKYLLPVVESDTVSLASRATAMMARLSMQAGELDRAESEVQSGLNALADGGGDDELATLTAELWTLLGRIALVRKETDTAKTAFARALDSAPDYGEAHVGMAGVELLLLKEPPDDALLLALANRLPATPAGRFMLASANARAKRYAVAQTLLDSVLGPAPDHRESLLLKAMIHLRQGQPAQAVGPLERLLAQAPNDRRARLALATAHARAGDFQATIRRLTEPTAASDRASIVLLGEAYLATGAQEQALAVLGQLPASGRRHAQESTSLALANARAGQLDQAMLVARQMLNDRPDDPRGHRLVAGLYEARADRHGARQHYERLRALAPGDPGALLGLARIALHEGQFSSATDLIGAVLAAHPEDLQALLLMATAEGDRSPELALPWLARAAAAHPNEVGVHVAIARRQLRHGSAKAAHDAAEAAARLAPTSSEAKLLLARAKSATGDFSGAQTLLNELREAGRPPAGTNAVLANVLANQGDLAGARAVLLRAPSAERRTLANLSLLGRIELQAKRTDNALGVAKDLIDVHGDKPHGYLLAGDALSARSQLSDALRWYAAGLRQAPSSKLVLRLDAVQRALGKPEAATANLRSWLQHQPRDVQVRTVLAGHLVDAGQLKNAEEELRRALAHAPSNPEVMSRLAWLVKERDLGAAYVMSAEAYKLAPEEVDVAVRHGWLLVLAEEHKAGVRLLERMVERYPTHKLAAHYLAQALANERA